MSYSNISALISLLSTRSMALEFSRVEIKFSSLKNFK